MKGIFKLVVAGCRDFIDYDFLSQRMDYFLQNKSGGGIKIIHGGAQGTDSLADMYAKEMDYIYSVYEPDYERYSTTKAPLERNKVMAQVGHGLLAFWDGRSPGTAHMINVAKQEGIPVKIQKVVIPRYYDFEDTDLFPIKGKYHLEPFEEVPASYFAFLYGQGWMQKGVVRKSVIKYIEDNRDVLELELNS